jgi:hypothetical protein
MFPSCIVAFQKVTGKLARKCTGHLYLAVEIENSVGFFPHWVEQVVSNNKRL